MNHQNNNNNRNKHSFILYKKEGLNNIRYIVGEKQYKNLITITHGTLDNENNITQENHQFSENNEANLFLESIKKDKSLTYDFNPFFEHLKIGLDIQNNQEDLDFIIDIWGVFTENLESYLLKSGNGYIEDDYFDEINNVDYTACNFENGLYTVKFTTLNTQKVMVFIKEYFLHSQISYQLV